MTYIINLIVARDLKTYIRTDLPLQVYLAHQIR